MKPVKKSYALIAVSIAALYISACSHTPSADDIPPGATFTANILADNTKLFVYSQRFVRESPPRDEYAEIDGQHAVREREAQRSRAPLASQKGLQAMLAQNKYCRDGYMILEQYDQRNNYVIRGECRDAAIAADRGKFAQPH